jgi:hypothetical protein
MLADWITKHAGQALHIFRCILGLVRRFARSPQRLGKSKISANPAAEAVACTSQGKRLTRMVLLFAQMCSLDMPSAFLSVGQILPVLWPRGEGPVAVARRRE